MANTPNLQRAVGNEAATTLSSGITAVDTTISVADGSVFDATGGYVIIDEGTSSEEVVYVESVSGNTLTIATDGRGKSGTTGVIHASGAAVTDIVVKEMFNGTIDMIETEHNDDGTHGAVTATSVDATTITVNTVTEKTADNGVDIENVLIKDNEVIVDNNKAFKVQEVDTTVREAVKMDASDNLQVGVSTQSGHTVLNAGSSKLVKTVVLRQDNTSDTYSGNQVILTGWGYVTGDNTSQVAKTVTFGVTFASAPIVVTGQLEAKTTAGAPTAIGDFTVAPGNTCVDVGNISTTNCSIRVKDVHGGTLTNGDFYGFTWTAIGTLS